LYIPLAAVFTRPVWRGGHGGCGFQATVDLHGGEFGPATPGFSAAVLLSQDGMNAAKNKTVVLEEKH
jgi:hypothetical protein